jgi:hypothetical protein
MKHLIRAAMVLLMTAGLAHAGAIADEDQFQGQFDGGIAGAGGGVAGQIGGGAGFQIGGGFSAADPGDTAFQVQQQTQSTYNLSVADDGVGNFAVTETATFQEGTQGSIANGGIAGAAQGQAIVVGTAGITAGGQFGIAGSAGAAIAAGGSGALGGAAAGQYQEQQGASFYEQQSVGPNSYTYQTGEQTFGTQQGSGAAIVGIGGSAAGVYQAGGSVIANDGNAGFMSGQATAAGEAWAVSGSAGLAIAGASAEGEQTHSYQQEAVSSDGTNYQGQTGTVYTNVQASSISP